MKCDKNVESYTNDQLLHYERIAIEQTKTIRAKAKMEKSISSHAYNLEQLRHANAVDELNRTRTNRLFVVSSVLCAALLGTAFVYLLFF